MDAATPGDAELVEQIRQGEPGAFDVLVNRYLRLAGSVAYGVVGDYQAASDVVQDAFIKLHQRLDTLREPSKLKSWFLRMVKTTAIDHHRRRKRRAPIQLSQLEGIDQELPAGEQAIAGRLEDEERRQLVREVIDQLPEHYREIVVLKYLDGLTYEEIAEVTGLSTSAVESKLFRARNRLKGHLQRSPLDL